MPLRNPISTGRPIRSARNPRRANDMTASTTPAMSTSSATTPGYSADDAPVTATAPAATSDAVAESAPTTSCGDEAMRA